MATIHWSRFVEKIIGVGRSTVVSLLVQLARIYNVPLAGPRV